MKNLGPAELEGTASKVPASPHDKTHKHTHTHRATAAGADAYRHSNDTFSHQCP